MMPSFRPLLCSLALFLALPGLADAAQWQALGGDKKKMQLAVDLDGKVSNGDTVRVWHRESYAGKQLLDTGAFSYTSLKALSEFNCAKHTVLPLRRIYYGSDGGERGSDSAAGTPQPITPDSALEKVFHAACRKPVEKAESKPTPAPEPVKAAPPAVKKRGKNDKIEPPPPPPPDPHWGYEGKSEGPGQWAKLKSDWAVCAEGKRQSPINIRGTIPADLEAIKFDYKAVPLSLIDNGHTVQVNAVGAGNITVGGESFELLQFHFHHPSEEKFNGKSFDMVVHLVHKSASGKLAVVAIPLQGSKKENKLLRVLWSNLPLEQMKPATPADLSIDPSLLLPKQRGYYTYMGSLTTPPCTEGVLWLVLNSPLAVSHEQISSFAKIYKMNARPVQAGNNRVIKSSR